MPKLVAIVPMRHFSERVPGKNYRLLAGRPLYHHIVATLLSVSEIDEVVIDTDSDTIFSDARQSFPQVKLLERPEHLRDGELPMNEVLANTLSQVDADTILQTHSTNPFLSSVTISSAIQALNDPSGAVDSVFGVSRLNARLWTENVEPVNHDPAVLLRTQDLEPLFVENSCFYIFGRAGFQATGNRIGKHPKMIEVSPIEAVDIDDEQDFAFAATIAEARV